MKQKWNWMKIKIEFFESSHFEVKGFFDDKYGTYNSRIRAKTTGWTKEKVKWQQKLTKLALDELQKTRGKQLATGLDMIILEIQRRINEPRIIRNINFKELRSLWEVMRCENGLSTKTINNESLYSDQIDFKEVRKILDTKLQNKFKS